MGADAATVAVELMKAWLRDHEVFESPARLVTVLTALEPQERTRGFRRWDALVTASGPTQRHLGRGRA